MPHLMIEGLNPHPLALMDAASFPILGMDEVDAAVFVGFAGGLAVIDVLVPFNARQLDVVVAAESRNCATKRYWSVIVEKIGQVPIDFSAENDWRNNHSHG